MSDADRPCRTGNPADAEKETLIVPPDLLAAVRRDLAALPRRDAPSVRQIRQRYSKTLRTAPAELVVRFARDLVRDAGWAERVVAWETLASHPAGATLLDDNLAEEFSTGLEDWGSVDAFGVTVLGQAWRDGSVTDAKIASWARSSNRWHRRLALVATVPLNSRARGGRGDSRRTLRVCAGR